MKKRQPRIFVILCFSFTLCVLMSCELSQKNEPPSFLRYVGWTAENIDPSYWTKRGDTSNATAFRDFWVYVDDPDGVDDIVLIQVTDPNYSTWTLQNSETGKSYYDEDGGFWGGWMRHYDSDSPHTVVLGTYMVFARDSAGNEITTSVSFNAPGSSSGSGFIYSENYSLSTAGGSKMLQRATSISGIKGASDITIQFKVDDTRVINGYVWFYDNTLNYITGSDWFRTTINSNSGIIYTDGITANTLQISSSELDLGSYSLSDVNGFHIVLTDGAQYAPNETWYDNRSISEYVRF